MKCKKGKICTNCGATFKMTKGCLLEKRCLHCKFLNDPKSKVLEQFALIDYEKLSHINDDSEYKTIDIENETIQEDDNIKMWAMVKTELDDRKFYIINSFFNDYEYSDIAKKLDISIARVIQIYTTAIKDLKHPFFGIPLKNILDID